jgi:hypothetical protein
LPKVKVYWDSEREGAAENSVSS